METTRYELPPEGITLLGYVVRRMHKTEWLAKAAAQLADGQTAQALGTVAMYAASSSTSYGRAFYQPQFNSVGAVIEERDPATGAQVTAKLESNSPHIKVSYRVVMSNSDTFAGSEEITGTTVGLRGLGMPAPSKFVFKSGDYQAEFTGLITSELALSFIGNTRIRAYGFLNFQDNAGNSGKLRIERDGTIIIEIGTLSEPHSLITG